MKRPQGLRLARLQNDFKKLSKLLKRVGGAASRLLQRLLEKRGLSQGLKVIRRLREVLEAHHLQPRVAAVQLELHLDFYSYIYISRPNNLVSKIYRDNNYLVWLYSLVFEVVFLRPRAHEVVARMRWWG